jgi:hypothetical protein
MKATLLIGYPRNEIVPSVRTAVIETVIQHFVRVAPQESLKRLQVYRQSGVSFSGRAGKVLRLYKPFNLVVVQETGISAFFDAMRVLPEDFYPRVVLFFDCYDTLPLARINALKHATRTTWLHVRHVQATGGGEGTNGLIYGGLYAPAAAVCRTRNHVLLPMRKATEEFRRASEGRRVIRFLEDLIQGYEVI